MKKLLRVYEIMNNKKLAYLYAFFYSIFFAFFPWEGISPLDEFVDKANYIKSLNYFDGGYNLYIFDDLSFLSWITDELTWSYLLYYISKSSNDYDFSLSLMSFVIVFISFLFILKKSSNVNFTVIFLISIFFLNPLYVDFVISQIRSAFALTVFLAIVMMYDNFKKNAFLLLLLIVPTIHTAGIFLVIPYLVYLFMIPGNTNKSGFYRCISYIIGLATGFFMTFGWEMILSYFGDRRAEYSDISSSFVFMSFWMLSGLFLIIFETNEKSSRFLIFIGLFFLGIATINTLLGSYASRFIAISYIFIVYLFLHIRNKHAQMFIILCYLIFATLQWIYWLDLQTGLTL